MFKRKTVASLSKILASAVSVVMVFSFSNIATAYASPLSDAQRTSSSAKANSFEIKLSSAGNSKTKTIFDRTSLLLPSKCSSVSLFPTTTHTMSVEQRIAQNANIPDDGSIGTTGEVIAVVNNSKQPVMTPFSVSQMPPQMQTMSALNGAGLQVTSIETGDEETYYKVVPSEGQTLDEAIDTAEQLPNVEYAQPNFVYHMFDPVSSTQILVDAINEANSEFGNIFAATTVNDPFAQQKADPSQYQWFLYGQGCDIVEAWSLAKGDGVTVAVFDSGCLFTHQDLGTNILESQAYDAHGKKALTRSYGTNGDYVGHGTMTCGNIGSTVNNSIGVAGVGFNAKVLPVKVGGEDGDGTGINSDQTDTYATIAGFDYIFSKQSELNIRVANMSYGGYANGPISNLAPQDKAIEDKIKEAREQHNIVPVVAAGNGKVEGNKQVGQTTPVFPSDCPESVSVMATNYNRTHTEFTDYNMDKDLSAPGELIASPGYSFQSPPENQGLDRNSTYMMSSGTSHSAPIVSGIFALMFSYVPEATVEQAITAIYETADPVSTAANDRSGNCGSHGIPNAPKAMEYLKEHVSAPGPSEDESYDITYELNNGTNSPDNPSSYKKGTEVKLSSPTRKGYKFDGWFENGSFSGNAISSIPATSTGAKTLYAKWALEHYKINYHLDSGTNSKNNPAEYTVEDPAITFENPTRSGYKFDGWFLDQQFNKKTTGVNTKESTGNIDVYAKWTQEGGHTPTPGPTTPDDPIEAAEVTVSVESTTWKTGATPMVLELSCPGEKTEIVVIKPGEKPKVMLRTPKTWTVKSIAMPILADGSIMNAYSHEFNVTSTNPNITLSVGNNTIPVGDVTESDIDDLLAIQGENGLSSRDVSTYRGLARTYYGFEEDPTTPDDPANPGTDPTDPDNPSNPDDPGNTEDPGSTDNTDNPGNTDEPGNTDNPNEPTEPNTPGDQNNSNDPNNPGDVNNGTNIDNGNNGGTGQENNVQNGNGQSPTTNNSMNSASASTNVSNGSKTLSQASDTILGITGIGLILIGGISYVIIRRKKIRKE